MEDVNKCKKVLSKLVELVSNGRHPIETATTVRELIKKLLDGEVEAEEFTSRLHKVINISPGFSIVRNEILPALRQLTPDSAAFIQQSQGPLSPFSSIPTRLVLGSSTPCPTASISRPQLQAAVDAPWASAAVDAPWAPADVDAPCTITTPACPAPASLAATATLDRTPVFSAFFKQQSEGPLSPFSSTPTRVVLGNSAPCPSASISRPQLQAAASASWASAAVDAPWAPADIDAPCTITTPACPAPASLAATATLDRTPTFSAFFKQQSEGPLSPFSSTPTRVVLGNSAPCPTASISRPQLQAAVHASWASAAVNAPWAPADVDAPSTITTPACPAPASLAATATLDRTPVFSAFFKQQSEGPLSPFSSTPTRVVLGNSAPCPTASISRPQLQAAASASWASAAVDAPWAPADIDAPCTITTPACPAPVSLAATATLDRTPTFSAFFKQQSEGPLSPFSSTPTRVVLGNSAPCPTASISRPQLQAAVDAPWASAAVDAPWAPADVDAPCTITTPACPAPASLAATATLDRTPVFSAFFKQQSEGPLSPFSSTPTRVVLGNSAPCPSASISRPQLQAAASASWASAAVDAPWAPADIDAPCTITTPACPAPASLAATATLDRTPTFSAFFKQQSEGPLSPFSSTPNRVVLGNSAPCPTASISRPQLQAAVDASWASAAVDAPWAPADVDAPCTITTPACTAPASLAATATLDRTPVFSAFFKQQSEGPLSPFSSTPTRVVLGNSAPRPTASISRPQLQATVDAPWASAAVDAPWAPADVDAPSTITTPACPAPASLAATATLDRTPVFSAFFKQQSQGPLSLFSSTPTRVVLGNSAPCPTAPISRPQLQADVDAPWAPAAIDAPSTITTPACPAQASPAATATLERLPSISTFFKQQSQGPLSPFSSTPTGVVLVSSTPCPTASISRPQLQAAVDAPWAPAAIDAPSTITTPACPAPASLAATATLDRLPSFSTFFKQQSQGPLSPFSSTPAISKPQLQPGFSEPGQNPSMVVQLQRAMLTPQVTVPSTPLVTLRNQAPGCITLGQQHVQPVPVRSELSLGPRQVSAAVFTQRKKRKKTRGTFKDNNDVASMAGVNLSEERANILPTDSGLVGAVTHSCRDKAFLSSAILQRRMLEIGKSYGVTDLGAEAVNYVSRATQHRLQNLLEQLSQVAQQNDVNLKDDDDYEQDSNVRAQLKYLELLDQKQIKEQQEREKLLKSPARQEDPEQLRLKQKAQERQEMAQMRQTQANLTALAAIGPRKRKRENLDSPSSSAAAEGSVAGPSLSGGAAPSVSRPTPQ